MEIIKGNKILLVMTTLIILTGMVFTLFIYYIHTPSVYASKIIYIPKGQNLRDISALLYKEQLIKNAKIWEIYARFIGLSAQIKAGEFYIPENVTAKKILKIVTKGKNVQRSITIASGTIISEILAAIDLNKFISNDLKSIQTNNLVTYLKLAYNHYEGMFYPDTYFYTRGEKASNILKRAHLSLMKHLNDEWEKREKNLPYKHPYDALIMASMIAKETAVIEEKSKVAGVLIRRLNKGMRLQSDPTVIYGIKETFNGKLRKKDLLHKTIYNTYLIKGLPPTPISLVTKNDINSALHPTKGKELYFVAKGDGYHIFSITLKQHEEAVKMYQLSRKSEYRSTPKIDKLPQYQ